MVAIGSLSKHDAVQVAVGMEERIITCLKPQAVRTVNNRGHVAWWDTGTQVIHLASGVKFDPVHGDLVRR
jgi:pyrroline-5-carboxylate reductase